MKIRFSLGQSFWPLTWIFHFNKSKPDQWHKIKANYYGINVFTYSFWGFFLNYCTYYSTSITQPKACCIHMCYLLAVHLLLYFFLQPLAIFQRSLTTMQIQIQGLLQFAVPLFPTAEVWHTETLLCCSLRKKIRAEVFFNDTLTSPQKDLLGIQHLLNSSEASLHQLTALLDCRGLNKVCSLHPNWH